MSYLSYRWSEVFVRNGCPYLYGSMCLDLCRPITLRSTVLKPAHWIRSNRVWPDPVEKHVDLCSAVAFWVLWGVFLSCEGFSCFTPALLPTSLYVKSIILREVEKPTSQLSDHVVISNQSRPSMARFPCAAFIIASHLTSSLFALYLPPSL